MFAHKNLVSVKELLDQALKEKKAIGAFNFSNMEILQAIVIAANEFNSPVILQVTESAINYMGMEYVTAMVSAACSQSKVALALHLDHGGNFEICKRCIDYGFSSVMIDKSSLAIEENIAQTKEVVAYARGFGVSVEAELGTLAGIEDNVKVELRDAYYTDPETALKFAEATGVDSLAVSIGTSHGPNKGVFASPKLDIDRLKKIKEKVKNSPLVLHGASSVYSQEVELANKYGASIKNAFGITDEDIRSSIENGIAKINVDTDIRIAFLSGVRKTLTEFPEAIDTRKYMATAKEFAKNVILRKLRTFN